MPTQQQIDSTTQKFLDIYDITNNLVILKDGTTSLIITVDAMNFGLLAEEEQDSIMYAYAGLLNSLNYPIQILIKSQTKDVTGYLRLLKEQEDKALNPTQRQRIMKYREFVSNLIRERNVLDKKFYVAIPAKPLELGLVPVSSVVPGQSQTDISTVDKTMIIEKARNILEPKRDHLIAQFARIGLYSRQLETQEIIQMFYQSYNPEAFEGQTMGDSNTYTAPLVTASIEETNMDNQNNPNQTAAPTATTPSNPVVTPEPTTVQQPMNEPVATTQSPDSMQPVAPTTTPMPEVNTPTNTSGYTPTVMTNELPSSPVATPEPMTNTLPVMPTQPNVSTPAAVPTVDTTQTQDSPVPAPTPITTPTPPAPELPKTNPGQVDANVPQEVEIKIEHPSEKNGDSGSMPPTETPIPVENSQASDSSMPPLPEIK